MEKGTAPRAHRPGNVLLAVLLVLAVIGAAIDLWDGDRLKSVSSILIALGLVALLQARRYKSSRWRMAAVVAFTIALAALLYRLAAWQGWV